jgi:hypothetical protein
VICHNCKRESESFELDNGETAYWFRIKEGDVDSLMSDMTYAFCCTTEKEPIAQENEVFWCVRCVDRYVENQEES